MCITVCKSKRKERRLAKGQQSLEREGRWAQVDLLTGELAGEWDYPLQVEERGGCPRAIVQNKHQPNPIVRPLQRGLA